MWMCGVGAWAQDRLFVRGVTGQPPLYATQHILGVHLARLVSVCARGSCVSAVAHWQCQNKR